MINCFTNNLTLYEKSNSGSFVSKSFKLALCHDTEQYWFIDTSFSSKIEKKSKGRKGRKERKERKEEQKKGKKRKARGETERKKRKVWSFDAKMEI